MNENEFEQHLANALRLVLPTFQQHDISSQKSFSIKFGHHNVLVDGQISGDRAKMGIYDILIIIGGTPVIMLELKKPGLKLTENDRDQGISYARLTDPITPVTIITNGADFKVYDTYSKNLFECQQLDNDFFLNRLHQASVLSKNAYKDSILTLIENDQRLLFDLLNSISDATFKHLVGEMDDVSKPIVKDFCVPRELHDKLTLALKEHQFVILTGDAYSGKTNLLYQFYHQSVKNDEAVLYINCIDFHYSVFRKLTNNIHSLLRFPIDEIKLKEWLLLHFNTDTEKKITIIFDHVRYDINQVMMADISELLDLFKMDGNRIIICADNSNYQLLKRSSDRVMNTIIGNNFFEVELGQFSTTEFYAANELMYDKYQLTYAWGSDYTDIYRLPRIWRLLISEQTKNRPENHFGLLKSVPGVEFLEVFQNTIRLDTESVADFLRLITAFIEGVSEMQDSRLKLMARSLGIIPEHVALKHLDQKKINRLIYAGYLERRSVPGFQWVLVTKLPELIAGYAIANLNVKYLSWFKSDFKQAYASFICDCEFLPYGELVACRFILDVGENGDIDLFSEIASRLMNDNPNVEVSTSAKEIEMYIQSLGTVRIKVEEGVESKFMGNGFPHLILAHLLCTGIAGEGDNPHNLRLELIGELANKPYIIRKADSTFFHDGIPTFELGRVGEVIQTNIGVVEPITQAILLNILWLPTFFESFFNYSIEEKKYQLLHRCYIAARNAKAMEMTNDESLVVCNRIIKSYEALLPEVMAFALTTDSDSRDELKRIENRLRALKERKKGTSITIKKPKRKRKKR